MKKVVAYVTAHHGYSERRACALTRQHRSTQRKPSIRDPRLEIRRRMHEIVQTRIRYGYRRVHILLKREGWAVGRNLVYRLYREEGLALRSKRPRRRKMAVHRETRHRPKQLNEAWSLDFIHDQLSNGEKFRALTIVDVFSREALAIEVGQRLRGEHVVEVLNRLVRQRGAPKYLFADNGAEFTGHLVDLWAYHHWSPDRLLSTGQADRQRLYRDIQWVAARRMPERPLVRDPCRGAASHRSMEGRLQ